MFNAELVGKCLRCISLVNNDALLVVAAKININEKERLQGFFIIVVIVFNVRIIVVRILAVFLAIVFFNVLLLLLLLLFYLVFFVFVVDCVSLCWLNVHRLISLLFSWSIFFVLSSLQLSLFT